MQLIDKYSTLSCSQKHYKSQYKHQSINSYNFTNQIKKRLQKKYHHQFISLIQPCPENTYQPQFNIQTTIAIIFTKKGQQLYDFHIFIVFNLELQIIQIRGHLCQNGIPITLQTLNRITLCLNISANLNKIISPIKICINPKTGAVYLQANVYTQKMARQEDEVASQMINKIIYLITLIQQNKDILLYLLEQNVILSNNFINLYPSLANRLSQAQSLISSLQSSLYIMNLDIFDKQNSINYDLKRQQFCLKYEPLASQILETLLIYSPNHQIKSSKKLSKLSSQQYEDFQIQNCKDSVSRKIQSKILTRVYLADKDQWITWKCLSSGGYGRIQSADVKIYLSQLNIKPQYRNSGVTKQTQNDLIEVTIIRKSDKKKIKDSRVVHQKQIIKNLKDKAHPNIATFLQVIPQMHKNKSHSQISNYLQKQQYVYLLYQLNTSLDSFMRKNQCLSLYSKVFTLQQAAKGLLFLHKQKIVHIDFKPANIFIGKHCLAKIGDFGESLLLGTSQFYNNATTFPYSPPQYNKHEPFLLTDKADVYSFGVTLFQCIFQSNVKKPMRERYFLRNNSGNSYVQLPYIQPERIKQYGNKRVISILSFLCLRCINVDSKQRPSMAWIVTVLQYCRFYLQLLLSK